MGGGCRSAELTLPGYMHDTCSAVHALALASPFLSALPLAEHGLELVHPQFRTHTRSTAIRGDRPALAGGHRRRPRPRRRGLAPPVRPARPRLGDLMGELLGPLRPPRHPS